MYINSERIDFQLQGMYVVSPKIFSDPTHTFEHSWLKLPNIDSFRGCDSNVLCLFLIFI